MKQHHYISGTEIALRRQWERLKIAAIVILMFALLGSDWLAAIMTDWFPAIGK